MKNAIKKFLVLSAVPALAALYFLLSTNPSLADQAADSAIPARAPIETARPNLKIMRVAHRGVKIMAPENTIASLQKAIELKYDYAEIDVQYTRDGVPVLFHDIFLSRKTNGFGRISFYKFERIKKLDVGKHFDKSFAGTHMPTLEEYLQTAQGKIKIYLDQKGVTPRSTIDLLRKYDFYPENIVVVGLANYQKKFLKLEPQAPMMPWLGSADQVDTVLKKTPSAVAFNTDCRELTPEMVARAHERGVMIFSNVLRIPKSYERECMSRAIDFGADAIQIDHPDLLNSVLEEIRNKK